MNIVIEIPASSGVYLVFFIKVSAELQRVMESTSFLF